MLIAFTVDDVVNTLWKCYVFSLINTNWNKMLLCKAMFGSCSK